MKIKIGTTGDGLKKAIEHAFEDMTQDSADGFKYPIGEINGSPIYITWENESKTSKSITEYGTDGMTFGAVWEEK